MTERIGERDRETPFKISPLQANSNEEEVKALGQLLRVSA
jgi:hypothetical protein